MGELIPGHKQNLDDKIMPFISSANISCGAHSGTEKVIRAAILSALENDVKIGAHPSNPDKENFGRKSLNIEVQVLKNHIEEQINYFLEICNDIGATLHHVKAHGALYNDMSKNDELGSMFIQMIQSYKLDISVYGMAHSSFSDLADSAPIRFVNEVFADRRYISRNELMNRSEQGAVIHSTEDVLFQLQDFINEKLVDANEQSHSIYPETICVHSDTPNALEMCKKINEFLKIKQVEITAP